VEYGDRFRLSTNTEKYVFLSFLVPLQAQHSPQAIFTSFKLERSDHPGHGAPVPGGSAAESAEDRLSLADHVGSATDLTPSRNRKRGRVWAPSSSSSVLEQSSKRSSIHPPHLAARSETLSRSSRNESLAQVIFYNISYKN